MKRHFLSYFALVLGLWLFALEIIVAQTIRYREIEHIEETLYITYTIIETSNSKYNVFLRANLNDHELPVKSISGDFNNVPTNKELLLIWEVGQDIKLDVELTQENIELLLTQTKEGKQLTRRKENKTKKGPFVGIMLTPTSSKIQGTFNNLDVFNKGALTYHLQIWAAYPIWNGLSIGTGLGISKHQSSFSLINISFEKNFEADIDGDPFLRLYNAQKTEEQIQVSYIEIPLFINYRLSLNEKLGLNLNLGSVFAPFSIGKQTEYDYQGIQTSNQYDDFWGNLDLEPIENPTQLDALDVFNQQYGLHEGNLTEKTSEIPLKSSTTALFFQLGLLYQINERINALAGFMTNIYPNLSSDNALNTFQLTPDGRLLNYTQYSTDYRATLWGVQLGLVYDFQ